MLQCSSSLGCLGAGPPRHTAPGRGRCLRRGAIQSEHREPTPDNGKKKERKTPKYKISSSFNTIGSRAKSSTREGVSGGVGWWGGLGGEGGG